MESTQAQKNRAAAFAEEYIKAALKVLEIAQTPKDFFVIDDYLKKARDYIDRAFDLAIEEKQEG